jgi:hypothetical protein
MVQPHNLPLPPAALRAAAGALLLGPLHAAEALWSRAAPLAWLGERFWADKREVGQGGHQLGRPSHGTSWHVTHARAPPTSPRADCPAWPARPAPPAPCQRPSSRPPSTLVRGLGGGARCDALLLQELAC